MWVKLSKEYLNLDHAFRVRLIKGFRNGESEWVAEIETIDPKCQVCTITRFRGADAELLQTLLAQRCRTDCADAVGSADKVLSNAQTGTVADLKLP
jgi:hypothetical protein